MTKKSAGRRQRDFQAAVKAAAANGVQLAPQPRQVRLAPTVGLHPLMRARLDQVKKETDEIVQHGAVPIWDELNDVYVKCAQGVMSPALLGELAKRKDTIKYIQDHVTFRDRIEMFKRDIEQMKKELSQIHAQHAGKTGSSSDPDELMKAAMINEQYAVFNERMVSSIDSSVNHILAIFAEAEVLQQAAEAQLTPEQDPNVVTDVVVKDVEAAPAQA